MVETARVEDGGEPEYDKVTQASLNGIYVKAAELDRGHNDFDAPAAHPPGAVADVQTHASTHASDVQSESDDGAAPVDAQTHASTHASSACQRDGGFDTPPESA